MHDSKSRFPRQWVRLLASFSACAVIASCSARDTTRDPDPGPPDPLPEAPPLTMFEVWERLGAAVRASPDHLPARAAELVARRDAVALYQFVRDLIVTDPPRAAGFAAADTAVRWGPRGTLRGGTGTPREKAELLAKLYRDAGFEAEVVRGAPDPLHVNPKMAVLRSVERRFAPALDPAEVARWRTALGIAEPVAPRIVDPTGAHRAELVDAVASLVAPPATTTFDWTATALPLVRVRVDGVWRFANPLVPGGTFGESYTLAPPGAASPVALPKVRVRLEGALAQDLAHPFVMVEREWDPEDVVGRRIVLGFAPLVDPASLRTTRAADVSVLVPTLRVESPELDGAAADALSGVGEAFSLAGNRYRVDEAGEVTVDGSVLGAGTTSTGVLAGVAAATSEVDAGAFPVVRVRVSATDATGQGVPGIGADGFSVSEDGRPVGFTLSQNEAPPPRVLLLYDISTSVTAAMPRSQLAALGLDVARAVLGVPSALVRVGVVDLGITYAPGGWVGTAEAVQAQLAWMQGYTLPDSSLWKALADARSASPTSIIVVTDADATDALDGARREQLANGAPILALGVGPVVEANLDLMAALSGGQSLAVADVPAATAAAAAFVDRRAAQDYVLTYRAPRDGPDLRRVVVGVDGGRVTAAASYTAPAAPGAEGFAALYLRVRIGSQESTRVLAGFGGSSLRPSVTPAMLDDVLATFFGKSVITIEAAPPPLSVVFDEVLRDRLALKPLWLAIEDGDDAAIETLAAGGLPAMPTPLQAIQGRIAPEVVAGYATFPTSLHAAVFTEKTRPGESTRREVDVVATSQWASTGPDGAEGWRRTLQRTAVIALQEADLFPTSTRQLLDGVPLRRVGSSTAWDDLYALPLEARDRWHVLAKQLGAGYAMLLPQSGTPLACWAVHEATGTMLGLLEDGSGGTTADCLEASHPGDDLLAYAVGKLAAIAGPVSGTWLELEKLKAKLVRRATMVIATGRDPEPLEDILKSTLCNVVAGQVVPRLPGGEVLDQLSGDVAAISSVTTLLGSRMWNPMDPCSDPSEEPKPWCL